MPHHDDPKPLPQIPQSPADDPPAAKWAADNRAAIEEYNARIDREGPALAAFRSF